MTDVEIGTVGSSFDDFLKEQGTYEETVAAAQERIAQLEAALVYYRDEYCEHGGDLCGRLSSDVCGGCNAATALKAKP
jgi:hypothetical protein